MLRKGKQLLIIWYEFLLIWYFCHYGHPTIKVCLFLETCFLTQFVIRNSRLTVWHRHLSTVSILKECSDIGEKNICNILSKNQCNMLCRLKKSVCNLTMSLQSVLVIDFFIQYADSFHNYRVILMAVLTFNTALSPNVLLFDGNEIYPFRHGLDWIMK